MKKKVLNLYGGVGGNRKLWQNCQVTMVEKNPKIANVYQSLFKDDTVIVADAHEYLLDNFREFDVIWSSPPCQKHSRMMKATRHDVVDYVDVKLYQEIELLTHFFKGDWVVENVIPYYKPWIPPKIKVGRHLFWSNKEMFGIQDIPRPSGFINKSNLKAKKEMQDWLGIDFEETIYYEGNHCPVQILRNCVHPLIGKQIYDTLIS